jgi:hypothetical protein
MRSLQVAGQNLVEVAIFFAIVVGVVATMQLYIQRGFQARYKAGADYVYKELAKAAPALPGLTTQYDPYYSEFWREDTATYDLIAGYPDSSVKQTNARRAIENTTVPGPKD